MRKLRIAFLLSISVFLLLLACEQKKDKAADAKVEEENASTQEVGFIPNPQVIEETEIKTLEINSIAPDFNLLHSTRWAEEGHLPVLFFRSFRSHV